MLHPVSLFLEGLYSIARSAGAVMYESNVRETFVLENGGTVTEKLFGFKLIPDNITVTQDALALGFDCGAPPEPAVCVHSSLALSMM